MTNINLTYCGMPGSGPTVKEAKQDAARKIEAALADSYMPTVITWRGRIAIIFREPVGGWQYQIGDLEGEGLRHFCTVTSWEDRLDAELAARRHLADNGRRPGERTSELLEGVRGPKGADLLYAQREFARSAAWSDRLQECMAAGMNEGDARTEAGIAQSAA
jgi:hypothetical protein